MVNFFYFLLKIDNVTDFKMYKKLNMVKSFENTYIMLNN